MELRNYQKTILEEAKSIINHHGFVYLALEMRLGKTAISLMLAKELECKSVLFVTKKKAIPSIQNDAIELQLHYQMEVINYESLHKTAAKNFDCIIVDEAHSIGQFPKPNNRCKELRNIVKTQRIFPYIIFLSGTPTPETFSQIYFQLSILDARSPYANYKNFYKWAADNVNVKEKYVNGMRIKDYTKAKVEQINQVVSKFRIVHTQAEAGFTSEIQEEVKIIPLPPKVEKLFNLLRANLYYQLKDGREIVADTPVKLLNKLHQISSGTVICEDGTSVQLSTYKADYIQQHYAGQKIAIYYKFIAEGEMLRAYFPNYTESPEEFNQSTDKIFISQIQSGSMGINLATADVLVFFNIDFSATQYYQARARLGSMDREHPQIIHWLFSDIGIESKVYKAVQKKKSYTTAHYRKEYAIDRITGTKQMYGIPA